MLEISPVVMLIEAGIFIVTLILLNSWLFKPLLSFMDNRDAKLQEDLKAASNNMEEVQKYEEEIASILEKAKAEASKIKKEAIEEAKAEAKKIVEDEMSKIESAKVAFKQELETERVELQKVLDLEANSIKAMLSKKLKGIA
ncbi:MAG: ATPase [Nautilia sp.]|nr:MAG: ATPase [Nautilia sp.]